jgi:replicative DNA helicase
VSDKASPHNLSAEAGVLGALLCDNAVFPVVKDILTTEQFFAPAHQKLFEIISEMIGSGRAADHVTLEEHFKAEPYLRDVGGERYLDDLLQSAVFGPELRDYAMMVRDAWTRRAVISLGSWMQAQSSLMPASESVPALIREAWGELERVSSMSMERSGQMAAADEVMAGVIGRIRETLSAGKPLPSGISTGIPELDEQLGKMHTGELIFVAARPAMGKTALALHLLHRSTYKDDLGVSHPVRAAFFSLEMGDDPLAHRVMSMAARINRIGRIPYRNIRKARIGQTDAANLEAAISRMSKTVMWNTNGEQTLDMIESGCRQAKRKLGALDLVVIDYLQLIETGAKGNENVVNAITRITTGLKKLAKKLNVVIVCLSQLSRAVEQRDNKRPILSDLRDSGSIEQDADAVVFLYRDEYYLAKEEPKGGPAATNTKWHEWQNELREAEGVVELICAKVRQGAAGTVKVHIEFETNTVVSDKRELQEERML